MAAAEVGQHDKHDGSGAFLVDRLADGTCVGQNVIPLDGNAVLLRNKFPPVVPQPGCQTVNSLPLPAEFVYKTAAFLNAAAVLLRKFHREMMAGCIYHVLNRYLFPHYNRFH